MRAIVDATPLIALSVANQLDILSHIFDKVIVPEAVWANALGLPVTGTAGLLVAAYQAELLNRDDVMAAIEAMTASGIRFSRRVIEWLSERVE